MPPVSLADTVMDDFIMENQRPIHEMEAKWQAQWEKEKIYRALNPSDLKPKFFGLIEFPYPSGEGLHVGHTRSYTAIDVLTRKRRMEDRNVLYPIGWDAFGLPTENYAIKFKIKPADATKKNIATFTRQLKSLGFGFDWSREVNTTDPAYYKWTQWQFLKFFDSWYDEKAGKARPIGVFKGKDPDAVRLAYKAKTMINWCPKDKIGLANEEVIAGKCERCGTPVEKREKSQWMIRITKYAERLIKDLESVDYLERIKAQQINWIGRSEGAYIQFVIASSTKQSPEIASSQTPRNDSINVFTTRPDTLPGATYLVLAPEHPLVSRLKLKNQKEVMAYIESARKKTDIERGAEEKEKTGVELKGVVAVNPVNGEKIPVWIADYVLAGYGTGAIMAVPAHDERDFAFAKKYGLEIRPVVRPIAGPATAHAFRPDVGKKAFAVSPAKNGTPSPYEGEGAGGEVASFTGDGISINSDFLNGLKTEDAKKKMIAWLEKEKKGEGAVMYKLRDWVFSRQRYWGEPIPIVHCEKCGYVAVPDDQLPVVLPDVEKYEPTDTGESPLAKIKEWVKVKCPKCGEDAERETDTMPNWAGSSWYFIRYTDPHNEHAPASIENMRYWLPVDLYNGGMEHTTLHLLYSRFWYKFLWDLGIIPKECGSEPYRVRRSHGLVLAQGGEKMSKSKGNVVNPDDIVKQYGADAFRIYELFMGPFDQPVPWDTNGIEGVKRFLDKVWGVFDLSLRGLAKQSPEIAALRQTPLAMTEELKTLYHQTVKKISEGIEVLQFNTCVSQLMILTNALVDAGGVPEDYQDGYLKILAPFAPHLAEEIWHELEKKGSIHVAAWPVFDASKLKAATFELVVQVNGKVRERIVVDADITEAEAQKIVLASANVKKWLEGKKPKKIVYVKGRLMNIVT